MQNVEQLSVVPFTLSAMSEVLARIQKTIDDLHVRNFAQIDVFTESVNQTVCSGLSCLLLLL
jgi:hypothetical protein